MLPQHHKNCNLAHTLNPLMDFHQLWRQAVSKNIYNLLGIKQDPMKNIAMATGFSENSWFGDFVVKP